MTLLSRREQDAYRFIAGFIARHGHAPTLDEIAMGLGIRSKGVIHRYLRALADAGLVTLVAGRHRGILLNESEQSLTGENPYSLPFMGKIAAGQPIEAIPGQDHIDLSEFLVGPNRFVLRVQGDSMIEAGILDGDMVVVERRQRANNGEIVVALIDGEEATLKTLRNNNDGSVTLLPANSRLVPMIYPADRVAIQGVVVGQMRSYR